MTSTGLLILSNVKNIKQSLSVIQKYNKNLYIHINIPLKKSSPPNWSKIISRIYVDSFQSNPNIDVRVLVSPLKEAISNEITGRIDMLFADGRRNDICHQIQAQYNIPNKAIYLADMPNELVVGSSEDVKVYNTVVLGGTFDRIHLGHKILLTEAVLRACNKLVVGVTDDNMTKSKKLHELILPVEQRILEVKQFLTEIDSTLQYEVVAIADSFGPTKSDPDMDMIIVSAETLRGGQKVNEVRNQNGLKELEIHCINLVEDVSGVGPKETKVSSSNARIDLLGTRLRAPEPRPKIPKEPYIIGLTGGIASGKSKMAQRFHDMGAHVIDCDKIAHDIYEPDEVCYNKVVEYFGTDILDSNKRIDRVKLGSIVFDDTVKLEALSSIVWPEILNEAMRRVDKLRQNTECNVVILEAAVLFKAGWEKHCHEVWAMIVSPEEAIIRIQERNGLLEEDARKRLNNQIDNKSVVAKSNVVFSSEWNPEFTQFQARKAWNMLSEELKRKL